MMRINFYEKPGCINNTKQKKILRNAGFEVIEHNLLTEKWTASHLLSFFASKKVEEWFNRSAPRVKSGEVIPEKLDAGQALSLMAQDPLLIRRPLIATELGSLCGFDAKEVATLLGIEVKLLSDMGDIETCTQTSGLDCKEA